MGQAEVAIIAVGCFVAGFVFRHAWPLFVAWQDRKVLDVKERPGLEVYRAWQDRKLVQPKPTEPPPRRRIGLAEMRARREAESFKPVEHQAQVTQNNIAAMEGK